MRIFKMGRAEFISICNECGLIRDGYCGIYDNVPLVYFLSEDEDVLVWNTVKRKYVSATNYRDAVKLVNEKINFHKEFLLNRKRMELERKMDEMEEDFL